MTRHERVADNLNRALHDLFEADESTWLLGEDVLDPYGGAFKITRGLSSRYPDRVLATPLSEGAVVGVAAGLALAGDKVVVEIMFGDFVALAFDQILNFASKSVSMYGTRIPVHLLVRCPSGGRRGYGPTHSQSLQKHFIGIPGLSVYEVSPFRDNRAVLAETLSLGEPCVLFEDKVLYTQRMYRDGRVCDLLDFDHVDEAGSIARVYVERPDRSDCVLVVPGGLVDRALAAARSLLVENEVVCQVLVPSRLYPLDAEPLLRALAHTRQVCVVEDSSAGGTWGAEVAHTVHTGLWDRLRGPVRLVHAQDSVIPTAAHLEREVLVADSTIHRAVMEALSGV
jgi:pyruvate/2-oxoglutarate/acetoin dehydrogenase E1 component